MSFSGSRGQGISYSATGVPWELVVPAAFSSDSVLLRLSLVIMRRLSMTKMIRAKMETATIKTHVCGSATNTDDDTPSNDSLLTERQFLGAILKRTVSRRLNGAI